MSQLDMVTRMALALEIIFVCIEGVIPASKAVFPLGGTHLAQLGLVLGFAVAAVDLSAPLVRRQKRRRKDRATETTVEPRRFRIVGGND